MKLESQPLDPVEGTGKASSYQSAPHSVGRGNLFYGNKVLYLIVQNHLVEFDLVGSLSTDGSVTSTRRDANFSHYNVADSIVPIADDMFVASTFGEGDAPSVVMSSYGATIADFWSAFDYSLSQVSQEGLTWIAASQSTIRVSSPERFGWRAKVKSYTELWQGIIFLIPGASGRLAWLQTFPDDDEVLRVRSKWLDPISGQEFPEGILPAPSEERVFWVDQGHVFSEFNKQITDHGRLRSLKPVSAAKDALALSPWTIKRSEDKQTLTVKSIFRGGPTYTLRRPGRVWTQSVSPYGLHALYDDGDFYDLRTGKLAATIRFGEGDGGYREFVVTLPSGESLGSPEMLKRLGLNTKVNPDRVIAVLDDLLVLKK